MKLDGALIRALVSAAGKCGGAVNLGRLSGVDPSCISRYIRGKVGSVSDENWKKLRNFLPALENDMASERIVPLLEWSDVVRDPLLLLQNGGTEELVLRVQGLQMTPRICDRDLVVVRRRENLKVLPENKIVVAVISSAEKGVSAVCKRIRLLNGDYWLFSDDPQGKCFQVQIGEIVWLGVVLRKICEL